MSSPFTSSSLLRFLTAGSVDDGKSTLIGRLLYDSKGIFVDQLEALSKAKHKRVAEDIDLSLLTDGLQAEREQGITIDVAYRYFSTPKRKFIIADAPGHEQYTRNMVTGASTADAVVVLIDAGKMHSENGKSLELLPQTKRHSTIAHLLGIQNIILAVNKMDQVHFDETIFNNIVHAYHKFGASLGIGNIQAIPISALRGDNVVEKSSRMPWYHGPTLMTILETLETQNQSSREPFRFPVQWVARHQGHEKNAFRGYMGKVAAGKIHVGDEILVQPSGQKTKVSQILTYDGELVAASAGQSVTLLVDGHFDISRGDMFVSASSPSKLVKSFSADLCWLSEEPLDLKRRYLLKHSTKQTIARVSSIDGRLDIHDLTLHPTNEMKLNDIARVTVNTRDLLSVDDYESLRSTGSFILIDEVTHETAAAGMIKISN